MANHSLNSITFQGSNLNPTVRKSDTNAKPASNLSTHSLTNDISEPTEKNSQSNTIRSNVANIKQSIKNNSNAINSIGVATNGLQKINEFLLSARKSTVESSKIINSLEQKKNLQTLIDKSIQSIDQIVRITKFDNKGLLNGDATLVELNKPKTISKIDIYNANFQNNANLEIPFSINAFPDFAKINLSFKKNHLEANTELAINGPNGQKNFNFAENTSLAEISKAFAKEKSKTGVNSVANQNSILLTSNEAGSHISISITDKNNSGLLAGQLAQNNATITAKGQDIQATVNGEKNQGIGQVLPINSSKFSGKLTFEVQSPTEDKANQKEGLVNDKITIKAAGRLFENNDAIFPINDSISIENFSIQKLGNIHGNIASLVTSEKNMATENPNTAISILDDAITAVTLTKTRISQFQKNTLETNENNLRVALENMIASESRIRDLDFATETAAFTKSQILIQSNSSISAQANTTSKSVINLLQ